MENFTEQDRRSYPEEEIPVRSGEMPKAWFRGQRFLQVNYQWYFMTRESQDIGPFASREAAEAAELRFVETLKKGFTLERAVAIAKDGEWAMVMFQ